MHPKRDPAPTRRSPGARSVRRRPEEVRAEIQRAGAAFLSRRPFRELTVEGLMESTSIGRSAFYAYFADRFALAEALLVQARGELLGSALRWFEQPGEDPREAMCASLEEMVQVWRRRGPMIRAIADAATQDERLEQIWLGVVAFTDRAIADAIRRDQAAGWIPAELDADETAIALNQLNMGYLTHRLGRPSGHDTAPLVETLQRIWIATLYHVPSRREETPR